MKETNFEHYKKEIEEIKDKYESTGAVCVEIIKKFNIQCPNKRETYFGAIFCWGMSQYEEQDQLIKLGFEKTIHNNGEAIEYFNRGTRIKIIFYIKYKCYRIKCDNVYHNITPEINNVIQEKLKEFKII